MSASPDQLVARLASADPHTRSLALAELVGTGRAATAALTRALGEDAERLRVLAGDRAKGFAWELSAERVWALHAEL